MLGQRSPSVVCEEILTAIGHPEGRVGQSSVEHGMAKVAIEIDGSINDAKAIVDRLGNPLWQHEWTEIHTKIKRARNVLEVILDSREQTMAIKEVFWAYIYCQQKSPRGSIAEITNTDA